MNVPLAHMKQYVEVISTTDREGDVTPNCVVWEDGTRYQIDKVVAKRRAHSQKTGAVGLRYTIRVEGHQTDLYFENPRWFVERKICDGYRMN